MTTIYSNNFQHQLEMFWSCNIKSNSIRIKESSNILYTSSPCFFVSTIIFVCLMFFYIVCSNLFMSISSKGPFSLAAGKEASTGFFPIWICLFILNIIVKKFHLIELGALQLLVLSFVSHLNQPATMPWHLVVCANMESHLPLFAIDFFLLS